MNDEQVIRQQAIQIAVQYPIEVLDTDGTPIPGTVQDTIDHAQLIADFIIGLPAGS